MPRAKGSGTSAKASAKSGATTNTTTTADGGGSQIFENRIVPNVTATTNTTATRGGSATRGTKRRRTSNNVNSSSSGSEIYGSGTIVASNPFDDDNLPISAVNHILANNKMMPPPAANQLNMHSSMHHQATPPHMQPPQQQQQLHHHHHHQQHHQQSMHHHNQPMYSHPHQNNHHHYQHPMQQSMALQPSPHAPMSAQPNHLPPGSLPSHQPPQQQQIQQQMHSDHLGGPPQVQPMHNHGVQMMPNFGVPPPQVLPNHHQLHHNTQPQHIQPQQPQQQQPQMIGSSTPPIMMGGPAPTHSPYNSTMQGHMMQQPHPAMTPQGPPPQQQLLPPSHHQQMDPMNMQQPSHLASNHIGYCGKCQREVYRNELHIICKAGCKSFFHISCSGLTQLACELLMKENLAEWACDRCMTGNRRVPYIKYKT